VTRATQTLAIRQIEGRTAVVDLPNVIRKHSMLRLSLAAALSMLNRLTPTSRSSNDLGAPFPVCRREIERIDPLRLRLHRASIERPDRGP
jgi:hypothetical protein